MMNAIKFNQCLEKIRQGDTSALGVIYDAYFQRLFAAAYDITKHEKDSEDIASNIITYILTNADKIGRIENPTAWLFRIVRNKAIDLIRKRRVEVEFTAEHENYKSYDGDFSACETIIDVLNVLTDEDSRILVNRLLYERPYEEIAKELNIPIGTVKSKVYYLRKKLKEAGIRL